MRRFWPGLILGAIITGLVMYLMGSRRESRAADQLMKRGDRLKEQAQAWWERSRERVSRGIEGMGDS